MTTSTTYAQLMTDLRKEQYLPIYWLQGNEPYYLDTIVAYLVEKVVAQAARSFDLSISYGKECTLQQVLLKARRFPMMSPYQLVIIKEAQELQDWQQATTKKQLATYLHALNQRTILVFVAKGEAIDPAKELGQLISQVGLLLTTRKPYPQQIPNWLIQHLRAHNYTIQQEAIALLMNLVGNDLSLLVKETEKLMLNLPPSSCISLQQVKEHIANNRLFTIFELQQAIIQKNASIAYQIIDQIAQERNQHIAVSLVALLTAFFSKILRLHHKRPSTPAAVAKLLEIPTFFAKDYIHAQKNYTCAHLLSNIHHLHQADLQVKNIGLPPLAEPALLKSLVIRLLTPPTYRTL